MALICGKYLGVQVALPHPGALVRSSDADNASGHLEKHGSRETCGAGIQLRPHPGHPWTRKTVTPLLSAGLHRDQSCSNGARPAAPLTGRPRYMIPTSALHIPPNPQGVIPPNTYVTGP